MKHECGSFKRNSSVAPFSLFIYLFIYFLFFLFFVFLWPHWLFLFISHLSSFGIFYLCPLWDLFLTLRATLYILQEWRSHTFTRYLYKNWNYIMMYANVCMYQCSRICNDTSASCSNYKGKAQLACGSTINQNHVW